MGDWSSGNRKDTADAHSKVGKFGQSGSGVWVQAKFNLAAYAAETVRIRLLVSGLSVGSPFFPPQWAFFFEFSSPPPGPHARLDHR
ncbi:MAG: hypothetical protein E2P00_02160 [Acidobacteria bacterium]|nr:MAG: hypothetical protein E2P00_02160 [Acidobacteriota bacterium]